VLGYATNSFFGFGATWDEGGNIAASMGTLVPLSLIAAAGGTPKRLTKLAGETGHRWPQFLPGGGAVLFTASSAGASWENANIEAISLKTGQVKIVQRGGYYGRYLPAGYLVYVHQGVLFGVKFDPAKLQASGAPVPILQDVAANPTTGGGQFDFSWGPSGHGTFVYAAGKSTAQAWQVDWLDSSGKMQPLLATPGAYGLPRLSPDGRKLAFLNGGDIYIYDIDRDTSSRLTFAGENGVPVWAPDGKHIAFQTVGAGLFWIRSDGAGNPQRVLESSNNTVLPGSFSPDGRRLAYVESSPDTGVDIWTLPLDLTDPDHPKPGKPEPFLRTPADESVPRFSPDGRWIAYRSNESGGTEIYVRPFPAGNGGKWQISSGGGLYGLWAKNGHELFYETGDNRIMAADYTVDGGSFVPGKPRVWSDKQLFYTGTSNLDITPDGKRFAVFTLPETAPGAKGSVHVTMLENFFDELKRRIP
jgi:serine/threonine-protein kinase